MFFLYFLWYVDKGDHYTSQIKPVKNMVVKVDIGFDYHISLVVLFDWYYPHLYNYYPFFFVLYLYRAV